jgi:hypothetical protein
MSSHADPVIREAERGDAQQIAALLTQLGYRSTSYQVVQRLAHWLPDPMSLVLAAGQKVTSARTGASAHAFYKRTGYTDICHSSGRFLKTLSDADVSSSSHELRIGQ